MPPDHGAAIAACIFADPSLRQSWIAELAHMRDRIQDMRALLAENLRAVTHDDSFDFIQAQRGMFSLLGVSRGRRSMRCASKHHIYMTARQPHESCRNHAAQRRLRGRIDRRASARLGAGGFVYLGAERFGEGGHFGGGLAHHARAYVSRSSPIGRSAGRPFERRLERRGIASDVRPSAMAMAMTSRRSGALGLGSRRGRPARRRRAPCPRGIPNSPVSPCRSRDATHAMMPSSMVGVGEQLGMTGGPRQHVEFADAVHHAGQQRLVGIHPRAGACQHVGEARPPRVLHCQRSCR